MPDPRPEHRLDASKAPRKSRPKRRDAYDRASANQREKLDALYDSAARDKVAIVREHLKGKGPGWASTIIEHEPRIMSRICSLLDAQPTRGPWGDLNARLDVGTPGTVLPEPEPEPDAE